MVSRLKGAPMVDNPLWEICEREALGRGRGGEGARDTFGARADRGDVRCRLLPAENAAPMLAPLAPELEVDIMKASSRNLGGCNALVAVWFDHHCPNAGRLDACCGSYGTSLTVARSP
jgi:hypothetical protein